VKGSPKAVLLAAIDTADSGPFPYLLYGGMAVALWGEPRYTEDVDIVLFVVERESHRFLRAAAKQGFAVDEDLAIQQLQVSGWARLPLGKASSPWHLDLTLGDTPFDRSALARRVQVTMAGRHVWAATAEDLVLYKLIAFRDKDRLDIESVVRRQERLDEAYLRKWAAWWEKEGIEGMKKRLESSLVKKG
jgi:hypothetical protein